MRFLVHSIRRRETARGFFPPPGGSFLAKNGLYPLVRILGEKVPKLAPNRPKMAIFDPKIAEKVQKKHFLKKPYLA